MKKTTHYFALGVIDAEPPRESVADVVSTYFYIGVGIILIAFLAGIGSGLLGRL